MAEDQIEGMRRVRGSSVLVSMMMMMMTMMLGMVAMMMVLMMRKRAEVYPTQR